MSSFSTGASSLRWVMVRLTAVLILTGITALHAENVDPESTGLHWAWSENAGWINAQPSGPGGPGLEADNSTVRGWLWSANVGWISANCSNTNSCVKVDYGLSLKPNLEKPGRMHLVGRIWSENAGWIVSHCLVTDSCDQVSYGLEVEIETGLVQGYAWSENMGWLSFTCANTGSCGVVNFGLQFDPKAFGPDGVFEDSFESEL